MEDQSKDEDCVGVLTFEQVMPIYIKCYYLFRKYMYKPKNVAGKQQIRFWRDSALEVWSFLFLKYKDDTINRRAIKANT